MKSNHRYLCQCEECQKAKRPRYCQHTAELRLDDERRVRPVVDRRRPPPPQKDLFGQ